MKYLTLTLLLLAGSASAAAPNDLSITKFSCRSADSNTFVRFVGAASNGGHLRGPKPVEGYFELTLRNKSFTTTRVVGTRWYTGREVEFKLSPASTEAAINFQSAWIIPTGERGFLLNVHTASGDVIHDTAPDCEEVF